jgi:hypothetical protein
MASLFTRQLQSRFDHLVKRTKSKHLRLNLHPTPTPSKYQRKSFYDKYKHLFPLKNQVVVGPTVTKLVAATSTNTNPTTSSMATNTSIPTSNSSTSMTIPTSTSSSTALTTSILPTTFSRLSPSSLQGMIGRQFSVHTPSTMSDLTDHNSYAPSTQHSSILPHLSTIHDNHSTHDISLSSLHSSATTKLISESINHDMDYVFETPIEKSRKANMNSASSILQNKNHYQTAKQAVIDELEANNLLMRNMREGQAKMKEAREFVLQQEEARKMAFVKTHSTKKPTNPQVSEDIRIGIPNYTPISKGPPKEFLAYLKSIKDSKEGKVKRYIERKINFLEWELN